MKSTKIIVHKKIGIDDEFLTQRKTKGAIECRKEGYVIVCGELSKNSGVYPKENINWIEIKLVE